MGRQLARFVPVDLPLLHGAAIGHDVGKFGCVGEEERRIPRLHYYYTHAWYQARRLPGLGHIATNHSSWDLEQVRLPIETMILIYADFRVKDSTGVDGVKRMSVISLAEAYAEIRDKLENLDAAKLRRYQAVYRKLRDFEDYALALGAELDPPGFATRAPAKPRLPQGLSIVDVMAGRSGPTRSVWRPARRSRRLRGSSPPPTTSASWSGCATCRRCAHCSRRRGRSRGGATCAPTSGVLGEYAPALSMEQKSLALDFFLELLAHRDDDIRYQAANRIGDLLALGEDFWRKDLPDGRGARGAELGAGAARARARALRPGRRRGRGGHGAGRAGALRVPIVVRRMMRRAEPGCAAPPST